MIKTFCDRCGRELEEGCVNQVNVDFNYYGTSGFYPRGHKDFQFCPECAKKVHDGLLEQKLKVMVEVTVTRKEAEK